MTTTSTNTRVLLSIPNPLTTLSVGQFSTDTGYNGVSVDTVEHVRFYGSGGESASDFVGQATGHVWLQSMNHLVGLASLNMLIASRDRTHIVAQKGLTIMAGFAPDGISTEVSAGTLPAAVSGYEAHANSAADFVITMNAATLVVAGVLRTAMSVASSHFSWTTAMSGMTANLAGAALNIVALTGNKDISAPGINMYSAGFFTVGSAKGSVNLIGVAGVLLASTFVSMSALVSTKITGAFHTAMNAVGPVDLLGGDRVTIRGWFGVEIAARTGSFTGRGKKLNLGSPFPFLKSPQVNTLDLKMNALKSIKLSSLVNTTVSAFEEYESNAMDHEIEATLGMKMDVAGIWILEVEQFGITASGPTAKLAIDGTGVTLSGPGEVAKVELGAGKVDFTAGAGSLKIAPGKSITVDGTKLDFK